MGKHKTPDTDFLKKFYKAGSILSMSIRAKLFSNEPGTIFTTADDVEYEVKHQKDPAGRLYLDRGEFVRKTPKVSHDRKARCEAQKWASFAKQMGLDKPQAAG